MTELTLNRLWLSVQRGALHQVPIVISKLYIDKKNTRQKIKVIKCRKGSINTYFISLENCKLHLIINLSQKPFAASFRGHGWTKCTKPTTRLIVSRLLGDIRLIVLTMQYRSEWSAASLPINLILLSKSGIDVHNLGKHGTRLAIGSLHNLRGKK